MYILTIHSGTPKNDQYEYNNIIFRFLSSLYLFVLSLFFRLTSILENNYSLSFISIYILSLIDWKNIHMFQIAIASIFLSSGTSLQTFFCFSKLIRNLNQQTRHMRETIKFIILYY